MLNPIQAASQYLVKDLDFGRCIDERRSGTAGSKKRGSWWGMQLRRSIPDTADSTGRRETILVGVDKNRKRAGPRRRGKEAKRCW